LESVTAGYTGDQTDGSVEEAAAGEGDHRLPPRSAAAGVNSPWGAAILRRYSLPARATAATGPRRRTPSTAPGTRSGRAARRTRGPTLRGAVVGRGPSRRERGAGGVAFGRLLGARVEAAGSTWF
jgi:hypothetical protein